MRALAYTSLAQQPRASFESSDASRLGTLALEQVVQLVPNVCLLIRSVLLSLRSVLAVAATLTRLTVCRSESAANSCVHSSILLGVLASNDTELQRRRLAPLAI